MGFNAGQDSTTNPNNSQSTSSEGSAQSSSSKSQSSSFRDPSTIWSGQSPYLQSLYQQGANRLQRGGWINNRANALYGQTMGGYDRMMNPEVNPQLDAYSQSVQRNLEQNLLPTVQSDAGQFGQMGGARQGVAEGVALQGANQDITNMAANLYNADMNRMGQAMGMAPALGTWGQQIPWGNLNQYAGILGSPTQLQGAAGSQSTGSQSSSGSSWGSSQSTNTGGGTDDQGWKFGLGGWE